MVGGREGGREVERSNGGGGGGEWNAINSKEANIFVLRGVFFFFFFFFSFMSEAD